MATALYQQGSGYRLLKGRRGLIYSARGEVWFARAPVVGIDSHLLDNLKRAADDLGLRLWVSSVDTGVHVPGSRHYRGLAVDISRVTPATKDWRPVTINLHEARMLARYFLAQSYKVYEGGAWPAVLLGPPYSEWNRTEVDHGDHLHVSLFG